MPLILESLCSAGSPGLEVEETNNQRFVMGAVVLVEEIAIILIEIDDTTTYLSTITTIIDMYVFLEFLCHFYTLS